MTCAYPMHEKQNDSTTTPPLLTSQPSTIKCTPYTIYMPRIFKPHKNDSAMSFTSPKPQLSGRWGRDGCVCVRAHASPRPVTMKHDLRKEKKTQEESSICTCYRHHPASLPVSLRAYRNTARTSERGTKISECCTHIGTLNAYRDAACTSERSTRIGLLHTPEYSTRIPKLHAYPALHAYRIAQPISERSRHVGSLLKHRNALRTKGTHYEHRNTGCNIGTLRPYRRTATVSQSCRLCRSRVKAHSICRSTTKNSSLPSSDRSL